MVPRGDKRYADTVQNISLSVIQTQKKKSFLCQAEAEKGFPRF